MSSKKSKRQNDTRIHNEAVDFAVKSVERLQTPAQEIDAGPSASVQNSDATATNNSSGVVDFHRMAMEFTNKNIEQAFAFGLKLFDVRQFDEAVSLQQGFFQSQAESLNVQVGALNEIAARISAEATKPLTESFEKSMQTFNKSFAA